MSDREMLRYADHPAFNAALDALLELHIMDPTRLTVADMLRIAKQMAAGNTRALQANPKEAH